MITLVETAIDIAINLGSATSVVLGLEKEMVKVVIKGQCMRTS